VIRIGRFNPWLLALGLGVTFAPSAVLASVASAEWEIELLRFFAVAVVGLALVWPWAMNWGGAPARRLRRWSALATFGAALYLVGDQQLYLILAFSFLVAGVLNGGLDRAVAASDSLRAELEWRHEQGPPGDGPHR
jgi:hypothetical protein